MILGAPLRPRVGRGRGVWRAACRGARPVPPQRSVTLCVVAQLPVTARLRPHRSGAILMPTSADVGGTGLASDILGMVVAGWRRHHRLWGTVPHTMKPHT